MINIISRRFFIEYFGIEILGMNGVLTSIISMLSLTESGIGIAIAQSLYVPLALNHKEEVNQIIVLFKKLYRIIAFAILVLGLLLMPFLGYLVHTELEIHFVMAAYVVLLFNISFSYLLACYQSLLIADQRKYCVNFVLMLFNVIVNSLQILITLKTKNYFLFLIIKLISDNIQNVVLYYTAKKRYPYLSMKKIGALPVQYKEKLRKNISGLLVANLSTYLIFGTDNLLLSLVCGTAVVGLYSNYVIIIRAVKNILSQIFQGMTASYGNFLALKTKSEAFELFENVYFLNFWISSFCFSALFVLLNPFIEIWIGNEYLLPSGTVFLLCWNFYSDTMRSSIELVRSAAGLYSPYPFFKYWSFLEAVLNLVLSLFLGSYLGVFGVFLGTSISSLISCYVMPWNVYKYVFDKTSVLFYHKYIVYQCICIISTVITYKLGNLVATYNIYAQFIVKMLLCCVMPNLIIYCVYRRRKEYRFIHESLSGKFRGRFMKLNHPNES
ncbi:lipopolysaccharide biosynthesis protein [Otoolea muris]|uniref:lipopolysaccharide biosynthesis protein n=1 Tax=Otoolea muris TaxID=2941515 RepID=UPI00203B4B11|nr:hypothetical protein [Otoolea muris]